MFKLPTIPAPSTSTATTASTSAHRSPKRQRIARPSSSLLPPSALSRLSPRRICSGSSISSGASDASGTSRASSSDGINSQAGTPLVQSIELVTPTVDSSAPTSPTLTADTESLSSPNQVETTTTPTPTPTASMCTMTPAVAPVAYTAVESRKRKRSVDDSVEDPSVESVEERRPSKRQAQEPVVTAKPLPARRRVAVPSRQVGATPPSNKRASTRRGATKKLVVIEEEEELPVPAPSPSLSQHSLPSSISSSSTPIDDSPTPASSTSTAETPAPATPPELASSLPLIASATKHEGGGIDDALSLSLPQKQPFEQPHPQQQQQNQDAFYKSVLDWLPSHEVPGLSLGQRAKEDAEGCGWTGEQGDNAWAGLSGSLLLGGSS